MVRLSCTYSLACATGERPGRCCLQAAEPEVHVIRYQAQSCARAPSSIPGRDQMADAVIVSTARTPLCKSWRGALNMTHGATMGGHVVQHALQRAKLDPSEVEDVIMGCANPEGATGWNIARQIAIRAGMPVSVSGMTVNRFCSSGLQTVVLAAQRDHVGRSRHLRRRRRRIHLLRAERNEQAHVPGGLAERAQARDLLADAGDRRERRQALQDLARAARPLRRGQPAQGRQVARRGQVQGRDRADLDHHESGGQEHRRRVASRRLRSRTTRASAPTRPTRAWPTSSRPSKAA